MPRYCAVKVCRNRGRAALRQDIKRISFYPFPLHDKIRLQRWVDNMKRGEWTPSRHQYLCSQHFTEDCFDVRWGIRYLKNTAIPTIFPCMDDGGGDKGGATINRSPMAKPRTLDTDDPKGFGCPPSKKPLILSETCLTSHATIVAKHTEMTCEPPLASNTGSFYRSHPSEMQTAACEVTGDYGVPTASCLPPSLCIEPRTEEQADSVVTVLCCEKLGPLSDKEALRAALSQAFSLFPVVMVRDEPADCFLEERGPDKGEYISMYEHSYCRPDTDRNQLWGKISSLHAKILELDRREESTVAKIRALEAEISLLKRDAAVFKEKQKVLEDFVSSASL